MQLSPRRIASIAGVAAGVACIGIAGPVARGGALPGNIGNDHMLWAAGAPTAGASSNNLIYHGGLIERKPAVYLVFWGPAWKKGFTAKTTVGTKTYQYRNTKVIHYLKYFFAHVGGSHWAKTMDQYCQNATPGFSCAGNALAQYVTSPKSQLKGVMFDTSTPPNPIVTTGLGENATADVVQQEALKGEAHFGYDVNATYFVLTQPGVQATAYNDPTAVYCGYHAETPHTTGHGVRYAFVPYVPEAGSGCGLNSVNKTDDPFGNGYLDGYSVVLGHEYAEAITDPDDQMSTQDGWNDVQTSEIGDKCAWTNLRDVKLGDHEFAMQPLWSNEAAAGQGACAFSRGVK